MTAAGAALLAACSADTPGSGPSGAAAPRKSAKSPEQLRAAVASESSALLSRYETALEAHPGLVDRIGPLRENVRAHIKALGGTRTAPPSPVQSAPVQTAVDAKTTLKELAEAERALADRRREALAGLPAEDARLVASIAAAGDVHAYLLSEAVR
ncbi:hypothetical protein [Streptomyces sp. KLOTTS4A1]|uniref:hypothetical protein n=1 Tax=Streptomyces sp. KLOTTS4A1 TaxID=3390996 RepID=UPI0039F4BAEB